MNRAPDRPSRRTALVVCALSVLAGLASAWGLLRLSANPGLAVGAWRMSQLAGSTDADPYTRARVALGGLLALNRSETMYYVADVDSSGRPLRSRCSYRVSGPAPKARWWSVTAYADDLFLFADDQHRYSLNGSAAVLDTSGRFSLLTGPVAPAGSETGGVAWLPTPGDRGLVFTLRLYQPDEALAREPGQLDAPRIEPVGACA